MKYFGPLCSPPSPECGEKVAVPEGRDCLHCDRPVLAGDSGFVLPYVGEVATTEEPYHRLCLMEALGVSEDKVGSGA